MAWAAGEWVRPWFAVGQCLPDGHLDREDRGWVDKHVSPGPTTLPPTGYGVFKGTHTRTYVRGESYITHNRAVHG